MQRQWIDTHVHAWDQSFLSRPWLTGRSDLPQVVAVPGAPALLQAHVAGVILVEAGVASSLAAVELGWMLELERTTDSVLGVIGAADWREPDLVRTLPTKRGLVGVRFNLRGFNSTRANSALLSHAFGAVNDRGLAVDILASPHELPLLVSALSSQLHGEVIINHLGSPQHLSGGPARQWASAMAELGAIPRVSAKVSGLPELGGDVKVWASHLEVALDAFGPGSLMLGSDWPLSSANLAYGSWVSAILERLGLGENDDLLADTAMRIYGLKAISI